MNTISRELSSVYGHDCYCYSNGSYLLCSSSLRRELPTISSEYEQLLIDNSIAYNKISDYCCEIYDKNCYETETLSLPVYVYHALKDVYTYTGKTHSELIPTQDTVHAANIVLNEVHRLIELAKLEEAAAEVKQLLNGKPICFCTTLIPEISSRCFELCQEPYRFFISQRYSRGGYGEFFGYVIVDLKEAAKETVLDLDVPENLCGLTIGTSACNLKTLITSINELKLNIHRINVHPISSN